MNIIAFTMGYWNDAHEANSKENGLFGYKQWMERVDDFLKPSFRFISCGTWSQPCFCPVGDFWVGVVNSDQPYIGGYDVFYNQYSLCAMTAGMAHALHFLTPLSKQTPLYLDVFLSFLDMVFALF